MISPLQDLSSKIVSKFANPLDRVSKLLTTPERYLHPGFVKDALSGTWLGHPLHPVLTDLAIGSWTSSALLDLMGGESAESAADMLVGIGVLSAVPTVLSGWSDWLDTDGDVRRTGSLHALGNAFVVALYAGSWAARRRDKRALGITLGIVAGGLATGTAYLGGQLVYDDGIGVDNTAFDQIPKKWTKVLKVADELRDGVPLLVQCNTVPVVLIRSGELVEALHDRCTHRGGPLHKGVVENGTVTCPWHGSCFRVSDGAILRGPATAPQPSYDARIADDTVEVRRRP
jgi:nitrite reductase/ring-hydroxylating ferredoxin subunit/uncharacterized membrane protein